MIHIPGNMAPAKAMLVALAVSVLIASCAGDNAEQPTATDSSGSPTPTIIIDEPAATATTPPTPTVNRHSSPTPTATRVPKPGPKVEIPRCVPSPATQGGGGTAPFPAPTTTPESGTDPQVERLDIRDFLAEVSALADHAGVLGRLTAMIQDQERTAQSIATLLTAAGQRNQLLCNSWRLVSRPATAESAGIAVEAALTDMYQALENAADSLHEVGFLSPEAGGLAPDTWPEFETLDAVEELAARYEFDLPLTRNFQTLESSVLSIDILLRPGWLVARNDSQVLLTPPSQFQVPNEIGPADWQVGTAVRIARVRNGENWNHEAAFDIGKAVLSLTSPPETSSDLDQIDGRSVRRHQIPVAGSNWTFVIDVIIDPDHTYFVQAGCPTAIADCTELADTVTSGMGFN